MKKGVIFKREGGCGIGVPLFGNRALTQLLDLYVGKASLSLFGEVR